MKIYETLYDQRSECLSVMTSMTLEEYKKIAYKSFENGGNLDGQRDVIKKSAVATKIRKRMANDFLSGAVFPPVVLGVFVSEEEFTLATKDFAEVFSRLDENDVSIIDGMQRSNIYFNNYDSCSDKIIRVEFWLSSKSVKLLYRMLVLNTGQVPWNTRRQVEVVFKNLSNSFLDEIYKKAPDWKESVKIMGVDDNQRRTQPGKYQESAIIQLYLGFNTRNTKVEVNEELANEFQRFDMMESIDKDENFYLFVDVKSKGETSQVDVIVPKIVSSVEVRVTVTDPLGNKEKKELTLLNGKYSQQFDTFEKGTYDVLVEYINKRNSNVMKYQTKFTYSYSKEYDKFMKPDNVLLYQLVQDSGMVSSNIEDIVNINQEDVIYNKYYYKQLLLAALIIFVIDIAIRKIRWKDIKNLFKKTVS